MGFSCWHYWYVYDIKAMLLIQRDARWEILLPTHHFHSFTQNKLKRTTCLTNKPPASAEKANNHILTEVTKSQLLGWSQSVERTKFCIKLDNQWKTRLVLNNEPQIVWLIHVCGWITENMPKNKTLSNWVRKTSFHGHGNYNSRICAINPWFRFGRWTKRAYTWFY